MKEQYDNDLQFLQELVTSLKAGLAAAKASIEVHRELSVQTTTNTIVPHFCVGDCCCEEEFRVEADRK